MSASSFSSKKAGMRALRQSKGHVQTVNAIEGDEVLSICQLGGEAVAWRQQCNLSGEWDMANALRIWTGVIGAVVLQFLVSALAWAENEE